MVRLMHFGAGDELPAMKIRGIRAIHGPNIFSHRPRLVMTLDLEDLAGRESCDVAGFADRLLAALPALAEHHCAAGRPGGFVDRLRSGTYFGHIVEHVALELSERAGFAVTSGKTVALQPPDVYEVSVAFASKHGMMHLLRAAVDLVDAVVCDRSFDPADAVDQATRLAAADDLGPSTRAIVDAAVRRGIPWSRVDDGSLVRLGYGRHVRYIEATTTDGTGLIAAELVSDKDFTKRLLAEAGIPVPRGCVASRYEDAIAWLRSAPWPVVAKPLDGNQGRGVSLNLKTPQEVIEAFELAKAISSAVIVEEMYKGRDFRVVLVNGRMVAAAERIPAHVWGDGRRTIRELIEEVNDDPRRGDTHEKPLTKIIADSQLLCVLKRSGRSLDDVPPTGAMVVLRESANLSTGGEAKDVTDIVDPSIRRLCERAARLLGLDVCGVDMVVPRIDRPLEGDGGIVEVNAAPGIRMHHFPSEGQPRDVGGAIVEMMFPDGGAGRIPIVAVTGTNGKTTVTRMIRHVLACAGRTVGMTATDGIWIGADQVAHGDTTGPRSAASVLADRAVEVAVLETARGGMMRGGLAYDWSDVGVVTNIQADHFGQDGIESLDDLEHVKRLVAERVREGGTLVLNGDDDRLRRWPSHPAVSSLSRRIVFFSLEPHSAFIDSHVSGGGDAYVCDGDWLVERSSGVSWRLARVEDMPATVAGTADFQIANLLASMAACRALGVDAELITSALRSFSLTSHSPGRVNLYAARGGHVVIDYAHNAASIEALHRMTQQWGARRVILVVTVPGDRDNRLIEEVARVASRFDRVIVREDSDLRGRRPGEVADLLAAGLRRHREDVSVSIVHDEVESVAAALQELTEGEVVVALCERVSDVTAWLQRRAQPLETLPVARPQPDVSWPAA